jgi:hypothetical protein
MIFAYEFKEPNGSVVRGTTTANSMEEAVRSLAKMGIKDCLIGEKGGKLEHVGPVAPVDQKTVIAAVMEDEGTDDGTADAIENTPSNPIPIAWPKVPIPELVKPPAPAYIEVRRRHSVLFGQYQTIQVEIQRLLSLFGEVRFMQVVQDLRGNVLMAIVIEHDEPLPKKEEKP